MDANKERDLLTILRELVYRRRTWVGLGIVISLLMLSVGSQLPKKYTADASIVAEERNIIGPLMEGMAEPTDVGGMVKIVRELAFSRQLMDKIIKVGGWDSEDEMSPADRERLKDEIIQRTTIRQRGSSLIGIEYTDQDPYRAYLVTAMYVDWVMSRSSERKKQESALAFQFIDSQVQAYHQKLVEAEQGLRGYRAANFDALPESSESVQERASNLRREIETLSMTLNELEVKRRSLRAQLEGEAVATDRSNRQYELRSQISALNKELNSLRLNYHDTYPDIVRVKNQISDLEDKLAQLDRGPGDGYDATRGSREDGSVSLNPLYEDLRADLARTETEIASTQSRKLQMERLLESEIERSGRIADAEVQLTELTRDYEVNRDIYQDLLRRRENARLSMNLDEQEGGLKMRVQEPPAVPQVPGGVRFMHVALASMLLVLAVPVGVSAAIVRLDPRIRVKERLEEMNLPVLAVVHEQQSAMSPPKLHKDGKFMAGAIVLVGIYATAAFLKLTSVI